jgi:DNA-binding protein
MSDHANNTIFIGAKPPMNYVLAIVTHFNSGHDEVLLKARGRAISRAVDVAEIVRNRFVEEADVKDVRIGTERVTTDKGRTSNVSSIEILLAKGEGTGPVRTRATPAPPQKAESASEKDGPEAVVSAAK